MPRAAVAFLALALAAPSQADPPAEAWPRPVRIGSGVSGHVHPAACVTKAGTALVVFSQSDYKNLRLTRSEDGGRTWTKDIPFPGAEKDSLYPGSLTALADGRVVHAWNVWYPTDDGKKSRFVRYSVSADDGRTWGAPKDLAKAAKGESVVRHPFVELAADAWLLSLMDRTTVVNPTTGAERPFGSGTNHGLTPLVRTPAGTFLTGTGKRSADGGTTWAAVSPFPKVNDNGWRFDLAALPNGWLVAAEVIGPGVGGDSWRFVVSRDDGRTWDFDRAVTFYNPGRPIGGRACPRNVPLDRDTLGTVYYDVDATQPGGPGVFFLRTPLARLGR